MSACVTNVEPALPDGWQPIEVNAVPEIAALAPQLDGKLTIGTNPPYAPFELKDNNGAIVGMEMDLARAVAQVLDAELEIKEQDFSLILPAVAQGQIDMGASGLTDTAERRKNFDFVDTLYAGIQWAQRPGNDVDPDNPCGLTVAVQRTSVSETEDVRPKQQRCLDEGQEEMTVLSYDTGDNAALAVLMGRADALSADSPVSAWAVNRSDERLELVGELFDAAPYGFAVPKGSPLAPALAAAMQHLIDTGVYAQILAQWGIDEGLIDHALINESPAHVS
ncbi:ABC transporter substrate-binding protein [Corynebacterium lizhenjunii]|nr:ABC transporter substrate-binding protein [Corynebacterium lizhenjunii]